MSFNYGNCLLRLTDLERQKLQLVVAALKVSEYTDDVDDHRRPHGKDTRMLRSMYELFDTITGLALASDAIPRSLKEALVSGDTTLTALVPLLEEFFEIFRRHKQLNPFSNRSEYGKLMMVLQDVQRPTIARTLKITSTLVLPLQTVGGALERIHCADVLADPGLKPFLRACGPKKAEELNALLDRYAPKEDGPRRDALERALRSADDVRQFLLTNTSALKELRETLTQEFAPLDASSPHGIAIRSGKGGACFSHSHLAQCAYVRESLQLWENVQHDIFELWRAAETDMLVDGRGEYSFVNTGQGFHRMCQAPQSYRIMSRLVQKTESSLGGWVGIKVIHLGDRDVPNPLVFIDKYTIIPRIVTPVVHTLTELHRVFSEQSETYPGLRNFLRAKYHSYEELRLMILSDFFRHAFDGSGDDGGSCIDGRLTSAWNWCHQLDKKPYYDAFVLTGFNGFD
ncbi:hypothetical protein STCU_01852 [Strigomonas culicis]|uniref:Non-canonical E2 ubiquitin-conjugating enzyme C-terminal domain-containing protein n=1 Tax=Strigomonas culicis TaxID=28005 RepID=S9UYV0_9TRYP|nr:hypothetical protein STCU_07855 [Strigomonas culicis]EPY33914.1 hypothetical protein STCU_01852 [Strigomonas culicis]|eukprot:EPY23133.1 hypothetical protein STCU_07855 [Strigomonas culicis]